MFKSSSHKKTQHIVRNDTVTTIIGDGCMIRGDIKGTAYIRVDGEVYGNIHTDGGIVIGLTGRVFGDIQSHDVIIYGTLHGAIQADILELKENAEIQGNIWVKNIKIDQGAKCNGTVSMDTTDTTITTINSKSNLVECHKEEHALN
jgi:cytoskeletal protein CcmA (bactofilin family)